MALTVNSKPSGFRPVGGGELIYQFTEGSISGKPNYRVEIELNGLSLPVFQYRPDASLVIQADIAPILRAALEMSFGTSDRFISTYVKYQAVWDGGSDSQVPLSGDIIYAYVGVNHALNNRTVFHIGSGGGNFLIPTSKLYAWSDRTAYIDFIHDASLGSASTLVYKLTSDGSTSTIDTFDGTVIDMESIAYAFTESCKVVIGQVTQPAWGTQTSAADNAWRKISYGNGIFVAIADNSGVTNAVMTSSDGVTWTIQTTPTTTDTLWKGIVFGNDLFVAVGYSASNLDECVMTSPDGVTWTLRNTPNYSGRSYSFIDFDGTTFVALESGGGGAARTMYSTNGIDWTESEIISQTGFTCLRYANNLWVAVRNSGTGNRSAWSKTGIAGWTMGETPEDNNWNSVDYGNGVWIAVASSGTNRAMISTDGRTWTAQAMPEANSYTAIKFGRGRFMAVSSTGTNRSAWTFYGNSWTAVAASTANQWQGIGYGNGTFIATSNSGSGNRVMTTTDPMFASIDVVIKPECYNPIYLKWINDLGGISTWLFSFNQLWNLSPQVLWKDNTYRVEANGLTLEQYKMLQELNKDGVDYGTNRKSGSYVIDFTDEDYTINVYPVPEVAETMTKMNRHNFSLDLRYEQIPNILL